MPQVPPICPSKSLKEVEFPLKKAKSFEGIISYLTRKHEGNVHEREIVTITSKLVYSGPLPNVADFTSNSWFLSKNEPGQCVCWAFHDMRVRPSRYTIKAAYLKSWVVESSLDFVNWTEIDRKTDNEDFKAERWETAFHPSDSDKRKSQRDRSTAHYGLRGLRNSHRMTRVNFHNFSAIPVFLPALASKSRDDRLQQRHPSQRSEPITISVSWRM
jgi:hypothetical protein